MKKILIILVTHSSYVDVCANFIQLFKKNWKDCKYNFVISIVGENVNFEKEQVIYNGKTSTLPGAIYNVTINSDYDYCISFLGDAFINASICNDEICELMEEIIEHNIEYCCLIPRVAYRFKGRKIGKYLRYISTNDVYNVSFIAFVASRAFVKREFCNNITDLEFEEKYMMQNNGEEFLENYAILTKNIFHLEPGIDAGKWNRHAYNKIKRKNKDLVLAEREKVSFIKMLISDVYMVLQIFVSKKQRRILKRKISLLFHTKFSTKY